MDDYQNRSYGEISGRHRREARHRRGRFPARLHRPAISAGRRAAGHARGREHREAPRRSRGAYGVPVACCNTAYMNEREMPYWKITAVARDLPARSSEHGARSAHPRARLRPQGDQEGPVDLLRDRRRQLLHQGAGRHHDRHRLQHLGLHPRQPRSTASATASAPWCPEDCVGDIEEQPHRDNLRDIGRRYVDVVDLATCLSFLDEWRKKNAH